MSLILDEHREYLRDEPRLRAFRRALAATVRPGDVVLDLASGTGILGYLACRAGAGRVYAIDDGSIVELARDVARANGFNDRVRVIRALSTWTDLPEPVDVIVTDQIGRLGFDAGIVEYMGDARTRWLKPGGRIVPLRVDIHCVPCEHTEVRDAVAFWSRPVAGLDFSAVRPLAVSTGYPFRVDPGSRLAAPAAVIGLDLQGAPAAHLEGHARFAVERNGTLDALAGWFVAMLAPGVEMTNAPGHPESINRRQAVLPLDTPTPVAAGEQIAVFLRVRPVDYLVEWRVEVEDAQGRVRARFRHSTLQGMLISREDLRATRPDYFPVLSPAGMARRTVVELCDGRHSVAAIEAAVYAHHAELLRTRENAAAFVAEVLTRYGA